VEDAERRALREVTRNYLRGLVDHTSTATIMQAAAQFRREDWRMMAELGLQGTQIAEELGGADLGEAAALLVHAEVACALYAGPFLGTVGQVVPGLQALGELKQARQRLEQIAAGDLTAAAAIDLDEPAGVPAARGRSGGGSPVSLTRASDNWLLDGILGCVPDAELADGLLVAADGTGGLSVLWVNADASGVRIDPLPAVDLTRRMARVSFSAVPAELLAGPPAGPDSAEMAEAAVAAVRRATMLALVAECVGIAEQTLEMTVGYVSTRYQFGRPVGSFQAVKHRCAELLVMLEAARSAQQLASTWCARPAETAARLSAARICAGEAAFTIANEGIHLHGGIGFTWEYPLHLYYRRAKSNQQLLDLDGRQRIHLAAKVAALYAEQEQGS
jgi:alkylation response protein AidB-like acyl-CoA dehydrogenase